MYCGCCPAERKLQATKAASLLRGELRSSSGSRGGCQLSERSLHFICELETMWGINCPVGLPTIRHTARCWRNKNQLLTCRVSPQQLQLLAHLAGEPGPVAHAQEIYSSHKERCSMLQALQLLPPFACWHATVDATKRRPQRCCSCVLQLLHSDARCHVFMKSCTRSLKWM
jgi:hypothetical protein